MLEESNALELQLTLDTARGNNRRVEYQVLASEVPQHKEMSSPSCCQSGCSGSEGALAHLAAQSRQLALPHDHHACIKIESQSSRCECTKPEQHVWIEVVEMQPYSTTWSFPATQWRYRWLREVYKSIKTFHFSLSTGHGDGILFKVHLP